MTHWVDLGLVDSLTPSWRLLSHDLHLGTRRYDGTGRVVTDERAHAAGRNDDGFASRVNALHVASCGPTVGNVRINEPNEDLGTVAAVDLTGNGRPAGGEVCAIAGHAADWRLVRLAGIVDVWGQDHRPKHREQDHEATDNEACLVTILHGSAFL